MAAVHGRGVPVRQLAGAHLVVAEDLLAPVVRARHQTLGLGVDRDDHAAFGGDDLAPPARRQGHDPVAGRVAGPSGARSARARTAVG